MKSSPASQRLNTSAYVYDQLRAAIIAGQLASGASIKQDEVAGQYGVSKIPVREALVMLEADGFVTTNPGRGAIVTELSTAEAEEIYLMRLGLEPILLARAILLLTPLTLARADGILHALESAQLEAFAWHALDREFHSTLYEAADLPRMQATAVSLHSNLARYYAVYQTLGDAFRREGQTEHKAILNACRRHDLEAATELLQRHLERSGAALIAQLEAAP